MSDKILSIVVPCYNSEAYLDRCIQSLIPGGEEVEIIIVNDGSKDRTAEIADQYAKEYPTRITVIHKENGGHGSGVNAGIKAAKGVFFKVVDSDDRLMKEGYQEVLEFLKGIHTSGRSLDMLLCNYVYDKKDAKKKYSMKPKGVPENTFLHWEDITRIKKYHYILMHSIIYRTELLRECKLELPEHTFYVDNIFAFQPLPHVKTIYYKDIDLYWYFIGREDQSVHEENVIKQIDQYIRVVKIMSQIYHDSKVANADPACLDYMLDYLEIIFTITCIFLSIKPTKAELEKKKELWQTIENLDPAMAKELHHRVTLILSNLPGKAGCMVSTSIYRAFSGTLGLN
ncbi:MAG: glycosyltransferase family 2 protein [Clostridiales bacterium]|nr:glycosyltransferase family 2 protein [Clostridiales bacterium]